MIPFKLAVTASLLLISQAVFCLPNDRAQPIHIEADEAEHDEKAGLMRYSGHVVIRQGSIAIEAEQVDILTRNGKTYSVISNGTPASYHQQPDSAGGPLIARGNRIEYLLADERILIKGSASVVRDGTSVRGDSIEYDLKAQTWNAKGNNNSEQKRIQLIIPPARIDNGESSSEEAADNNAPAAQENVNDANQENH